MSVLFWQQGGTPVSVKFYIMLPDGVVWRMPDNRVEVEFSQVAGDALTPEWQVQANKVSWLSNRAQIIFKSGSE